jgi:hypothetical protein
MRIEEIRRMKVLHDWDRLWIDGGWALKRSISLFCYLLSRKLPILRRIKYFHENTERIQAEQLAYMETLIKLNKLSGVSSIFGIRDAIREKYGEEIDKLALQYGVDVRRHIHIGEFPDPDRIRLYEPPLNQSKDSWHFDTKWARGEEVSLKSGELPIFHVDRPHHLAHYINYLFEIKENEDR